MPLCDTVLRLASLQLFAPHWSEMILAEVEHTLEKFGKTPGQIARRLSRMREAFPEAVVDGFEHLVPVMTNDKKDRHVLAAAVRGGVDLLVTRNLRHFPPSATEPYAVEVQPPDEFLLNVLDLYPKQILTTVRRQAATLQHENDLDDVVFKLAAQVPQFAQAIDTLIRAGA